MTYQDLFNQMLTKIRIATNATGNKPLGDTIVKILFDFSDDMKSHNLIIGDTDNDRKKTK
jgi:hypothetical protein